MQQNNAEQNNTEQNAEQNEATKPQPADQKILIGTKVKLLDHGHVALLDYMGNDAAIVQAARTCYDEASTRRVSDDTTLIRLLFRHEHSTPFESCCVKFHVKLPIFVERQWARHRTAGWNEVSARYSQLPEEYYIPAIDQIRKQSRTNKQGRDEPVSESYSIFFQESLRRQCQTAFAAYKDYLSHDIARELARLGLPLNTYTTKVWWINLRNLIHLLNLRCDAHAQWEIREYANAMLSFAEQLFPAAIQAFKDYKFNAITFSVQEQFILTQLLQCKTQFSKESLRATILHESEQHQDVFTKREIDEFLGKLDTLNYFDARTSPPEKLSLV